MKIKLFESDNINELEGNVNKFLSNVNPININKVEFYFVRYRRYINSKEEKEIIKHYCTIQYI